MLRIPWIYALAATLLVACGDGTIKQSDRCQPEGSVCADGQVCASGACVPCTGNDQCGGLVCLVGRCRTCTDDFQCGAGKLCLGGTCRGCQKSLDCPLQQACVNETCVPCASSTDCGDGRACIDGKCAACERDTQCDNGKVCVESACVACTDTHQCHDGLACIAGACTACTDSTQCLDGDVCAGGRCGTCASRDQCPTGEVCANGHCTNCATSDDCEKGEACVGGLCGVCHATSECAAGEVCRDGVCGKCGTSAECEGGHVCVQGACQPCTTRAQCDTGEVCAQGSCRPCAAQAECLAGEACISGRCGPCNSADDCAAGDACVAGTCGPCTRSTDCRAGEICHGSTHRCGQPGAPDHLELVGGQNQRGVVGTRLSQDLALRVVDASNDPVPNIALTFAPMDAAYGQPGAATVTSDRDGLASTTWLLGPLQGQQYLKVSRTPALPDAAGSGRATFTFAATADADVPDHLGLLGGNAQTVAAGTKAPLPLAVKVVDKWGNGIPGVRLGWTAATGGGTLDTTTATTTSDGSAQVNLTLGRTPGSNTVTVARTPALPDVNALGKASLTFTLTGVPGPADHLEKVAGDNQSAQLRKTLSTDPQVRVLDRFDNAVPGATVRFSATGGLEISAPAATANANGIASTHVTIGTLAGAQTVTASGSPAFPDLAGTGRASVSFAVTALPGDPDHLDLIAGDGQSAILGTKLPIDPAVRVVDAYGNPLSGVSVAFSPAANNGQVTSATVTTNAQGLASTSWTLGFVAGAQTMIAGRNGAMLPDLAGTGHAVVTFTATAPMPTVNAISPTWLPIAGGTLTITGSGFGSDAAVTVGGQAATVTSRTDSQLVVTAPSVARGDEPVLVTSGGTTTSPQNVFYALKFTPNVDGQVVTGAGDWPWQSNVASNVYPAGTAQAGQPVATAWDGNELRELYLGYDDTNVYIGVIGRAQKQNAIVGYISEDGLTSLTRPNATADIRTLSDGVGDGQGDGNGCYWQTPTCSNNGQALSLDDMLSSAFQVQVPGWYAHYGFGRTGNAIDLTSLGVHNATGVRDLFNGADFGWSNSRVVHTANAQEWAIPWTTFARDKINNGTASRPITKLQVFVRIVGNGGQAFPNQGLPADANSIATDYRVTSVSTLDVR